MPERLTSDEVAHVARLARLTITPDELELFTSQLGKILDHANQMASLDLDGIEPTPHPYPLRNVMREDELVPTLDRDEVLAAAPSAQDGMFRVPPVLGDEP
jgi:aspartyl-tRNA(Asn)/glutamyl-tRNA(Gln) amidotransferase subunit C